MSPPGEDDPRRPGRIADGATAGHPPDEPAATALRHVRGVGAVSWYDDAAQSFIDTRFGEPRFALVFVDAAEGTVSAGREATRELCDRAGLPVLLQDVVGDRYESIADAIRTGVDRDPDPYRDVLPLADPARDRFGALADAAGHTPYVSTG